MQDDERKIPIHFGVQRSRSQLNFVNITSSFHISNIDARWREEDTYTVLGQKVKGLGNNGTLSTLWLWHNNLSSFSTYILHISYIDVGWQEEVTYTFLGQKVEGQGHNWTLSTIWFWHDNLSIFQCTAFIFHISYIDAGWWEEDTYIFWGQKVKVTTELCQHFGSDKILSLSPRK